MVRPSLMIWGCENVPGLLLFTSVCLKKKKKKIEDSISILQFSEYRSFASLDRFIPSILFFLLQ